MLHFNDSTLIQSRPIQSRRFSPDYSVRDISVLTQFSPGRFSPRLFSPRWFSPRLFSPEQFSPRRFSPKHFSPRRFSPRHFSPKLFSPRHFSPKHFSPRPFSPEIFQSQDISVLNFSVPRHFSPISNYYKVMRIVNNPCNFVLYTIKNPWYYL